MASRRLLALIFGFLSLSAIAATSLNLPHTAAAASTRTISLIGIVAGWNNTSNRNPTITANQGDMLSIKLSSGDGAEHFFLVDVDKNGSTPDCPGPDVCSGLFIAPITFSFNVTFAPGTYTYYCSVHPTTMFGSFIVLQAPPPTVGSGGGRHPLVE